MAALTKLAKISAIICTKNRSDSLILTLNAMAKLNLSGSEQFELVIVDNNSADDTRQVVAEFAKTAPFPVICLSENRPGVCFAKNRGLDAATGDVIMMTDDDCLVAEDWVQVACRLFANDPLQLIGGRIELYNEDHLPLSIKTQLSREELASPYHVMGFFHGANMAFGRALIGRIGKFDVRLGPGRPLQAAEDAEYIYRAFINGVPVIYEPSLVVHHDHGRAGTEEWDRAIRNYSIGSGAMMMKYLLRGKTDLAKIFYWDVLSLLRDQRAGVSQQPWLFAKLAALNGALRFLVSASWKKAE